MNHEQQNPFDDENGQFYVLINAKQQYSLWPIFACQPEGWQCVLGPENRKNCIAYIEKYWLKIQPSDAEPISPNGH